MPTAEQLAALNSFIAGLSPDARGANSEIKRALLKGVNGCTKLFFFRNRLSGDDLIAMFAFLREHAPHIAHFEVSGNLRPITLSDGVFAGMNALESIHFNFTPLNVEQGAISDLPALRTIKLERARLNRLRVGMIRNCPELRSMVFDNNMELHDIDAGFFASFEKLEVISLAKSSLPKELPDNVFEDLLSLKRLNISGTHRLIKKLRNLPMLETLQATGLRYTPERLTSIASNRLTFIGEPDEYLASRASLVVTNMLTLRQIVNHPRAMMRSIYTPPFPGCLLLCGKRILPSWKAVMNALTHPGIFRHVRRASHAVAGTVFGAAHCRELKVLKPRAEAGGGVDPLTSLPYELKRHICEYALPFGPFKAATERDSLNVSFQQLGIKCGMSQKQALALFYRHFDIPAPQRGFDFRK